jgi:hypothetical protein
LADNPDPLLRQLDAKYSVHTNLNEGLQEVAKGEALRIESQQMLRYRIKEDFTDASGKSPLHISRNCLMDFNVVIYTRRNAMFTPVIGHPCIL